MEVLKAEAVSLSPGGLIVLEDISFSIEEGERVAIIGPNGAGKTPLFDVLSGFIPPVAGRVHLMGNDVTRMPPHRRASLGLARSFQTNTLFPRLSLLANVLLAIKGVQAARYQMVRRITAYKDNLDRARELLELVDLWEERESAVTALSHGQQRLVENILVVARKPPLFM